MAYKTEGKLDTTYLPPYALEEMNLALAEGGIKHGRDNYLINPDVTDEEIFAAIMRHWLECRKHGIFSPVTDSQHHDYTHLAAIMANAAMLLERQAKRIQEVEFVREYREKHQIDREPFDPNYDQRPEVLRARAEQAALRGSVKIVDEAALDGVPV